MTSLSFNTTTANTNALMSMPSIGSLSKKTTAAKSNYSYSFVAKNSSRKSAVRLSSVDWDLNMNELEFE